MTVWSFLFFCKTQCLLSVSISCSFFSNTSAPYPRLTSPSALVHEQYRIFFGICWSNQPIHHFVNWSINMSYNLSFKPSQCFSSFFLISMSHFQSYVYVNIHIHTHLNTFYLNFQQMGLHCNFLLQFLFFSDFNLISRYGALVWK